MEEKLNVRDVELIAQDNTIEKKHKIINKKHDSEYLYLENSLSEKLGTKVKINNKKIVINFTNDKDLDRIIEILQIKE